MVEFEEKELEDEVGCDGVQRRSEAYSILEYPEDVIRCIDNSIITLTSIQLLIVIGHNMIYLGLRRKDKTRFYSIAYP